jgi:hypothetical protein
MSRAKFTSFRDWKGLLLEDRACTGILDMKTAQALDSHS